MFFSAARTASIRTNSVAVVTCLVASDLLVSAACVTSVDSSRVASVTAVSALDGALGRASVVVEKVAIITEIRPILFCPECLAVSTRFVSYEPNAC
jgi:hypothetical protein